MTTAQIAAEAVVAAVKRCRYNVQDYVAFVDVLVALGVAGDDFRVVDRALQRARKEGAIKWDSQRGWTVAEKKA
jgi:hypothetical protein